MEPSPSEPAAEKEKPDYSNFYLEAEALAEANVGSAHGSWGIELWWAVQHPRMAVRERPDRRSKALDVLTKGAVVRGAAACPRGNPPNPWVKVLPADMRFMVNKSSTGEAWLLVHDPELGLDGPLIQPLPEELGRLLDGSVHPQQRAGAAILKAKEEGMLPDPAEADDGAPTVPSGGVEARAPRGGPTRAGGGGADDDEQPDDCAADGEQPDEYAARPDDAERDQGVATYEHRAGPPRPPAAVPIEDDEISYSKSVFKDGQEVD